MQRYARYMGYGSSSRSACRSTPPDGVLGRHAQLDHTIQYHTIPYYHLYYTMLYYTMLRYTILCYTTLGRHARPNTLEAAARAYSKLAQAQGKLTPRNQELVWADVQMPTSQTGHRPCFQTSWILPGVAVRLSSTPNLPTNIIPTNIA